MIENWLIKFKLRRLATSRTVGLRGLGRYSHGGSGKAKTFSVVAKKKVLTELLKCIDELINEKTYQNIYMGIFTPKSKQVFLPEEIEAFSAFQEKTSSKKPEKIRREELLKVILKPLATFFEEHL